MKSIANFVMVVLLLASAAAPVWAQEPAQPQEPADVTAYRPIFEARTAAPKKAIELAEAFLAETRPEFLESTWRDNVFLILFTGYKQDMNWVKVLETIDRAEKLVPKIAADNSAAPFDKLRLYSDAMTIAANQIGSVEKTLEYAKKIKSIDPKNVDALYTLARVLPPPPANPAETDAAIEAIIENGRRFLEIATPAGATDDQWRAIQKPIEVQTKDYIARRYLNKNDYVECAKAFEALLKLNPKDSVALYRLGFCYYKQTVPAYEAVAAAREKLRAFLTECNNAHEAEFKRLEAFINECNTAENCGSDENKEKKVGLDAKYEATACDAPANKATTVDLEEKENVVRKDFTEKRDKAMDALGKSVAIGGPGSDGARSDLEKLFKIMPDATFSLEEFVAQRKKDLGV